MYALITAQLFRCYIVAKKLINQSIHKSSKRAIETVLKNLSKCVHQKIVLAGFENFT